MRIQETDQILKEARYARHAVHQQEQEHEGEGVMSRAWKAIASLPAKLTGLFKKH